jgi:hypothetical protein
MTYRNKSQHADAPAPEPEVSKRPRRRIGYANVAATLALVLALGGGTAWAAHHYHYLITSTKQIKPSVLSSLKTPGLSGAAGQAGPAGPAGATGQQGVQGPQGPGATVFVDSQTQASESTAVGAIPVTLDCVNEGSSSPPDALLLSSQNAGTYAAQWQLAAAGFSETPETYTDNGDFPDSGAIASSVTGDVSTGTAIFVTTAGTLPIYTTTTETITFELSTTGTGSSGICSIDAQIVTGSETEHLTV